MTDDPYQKALAEALSNPVLAEQLAGLSDDPLIAAEELRMIIERTEARFGRPFEESA